MYTIHKCLKKGPSGIRATQCAQLPQLQDIWVVEDTCIFYFIFFLVELVLVEFECRF